MMSTILMICAAVAPAVILANIILRLDMGKPEPRKLLFISAAPGLLSAIMAVVAVMLTLPDFETTQSSTHSVGNFGNTIRRLRLNHRILLFLQTPSALRTLVERRFALDRESELLG